MNLNFLIVEKYKRISCFHFIIFFKDQPMALAIVVELFWKFQKISYFSNVLYEFPRFTLLLFYFFHFFQILFNFLGVTRNGVHGPVLCDQPERCVVFKADNTNNKLTIYFQIGGKKESGSMGWWALWAVTFFNHIHPNRKLFFLLKNY